MSKEDDIVMYVEENNENNTNENEYVVVSSREQQCCNEYNNVSCSTNADNVEVSDHDEVMQSSSSEQELQNNERNNNNNESNVGWGPNAMFAYPAHGGNGALYNAMYSRCCERELLSSSELSSSHFRVGRANRVVGIDICNDKRVILANGESVAFDYLISTMPLDVLLRMIATSLEQHCKHKMCKFDCKIDRTTSSGTSVKNNTNKSNENLKISVEETREVSTRNIYHHHHHHHHHIKKEIKKNCIIDEITSTNTNSTNDNYETHLNRANRTFDEDKTNEEASNLTIIHNSPCASQLRSLASQLRYTSVHVIGLGISGATPSTHLQRVSWIYFPDADTPFYRATMLSNYAKDNAPAHCWSLLLEISEEATNNYNNKENKNKKLKEHNNNGCRSIMTCHSINKNIENLKNVKFAENNMQTYSECKANTCTVKELEKNLSEEEFTLEKKFEENQEKYSELFLKCIAACKVHHLLDESKYHIVCKWHKYIKRGYPVPTIRRDDVLHAVLPMLESKWSVWSRGRFGLWKYELSNQDHSIMQGKHAVDDILTVITNQSNQN